MIMQIYFLKKFLTGSLYFIKPEQGICLSVVLSLQVWNGTSGSASYSEISVSWWRLYHSEEENLTCREEGSLHHPQGALSQKALHGALPHEGFLQRVNRGCRK